MTLYFAAARVKFSSPSGCPSLPRAVAVCNERGIYQKYQKATVPKRTYDVDWHRRLVTEDSGGKVDCGHVDKYSRSKPDAIPPRIRRETGLFDPLHTGGKPYGFRDL